MRPVLRRNQGAANRLVYLVFLRYFKIEISSAAADAISSNLKAKLVRNIGSANEYMKDHIFELRTKIWIHNWSSQLYTQLKRMWNYIWKKFSPERDSKLWPLRYRCSALTTEELVTLWVRNIPVESEQCKWIYERSRIWTAEKDMNSWLIIMWPDPSWLGSPVGRALHRYRVPFVSRSGLHFFSGFNFTTALVVCITAMIGHEFQTLLLLSIWRWLRT